MVNPKLPALFRSSEVFFLRVQVQIPCSLLPHIISFVLPELIELYLNIDFNKFISSLLHLTGLFFLLTMSNARYSNACGV